VLAVFLESSLAMFGRFLLRHSAVVALLVICGLSSLLTIDQQFPEGAEAAEQLAAHISSTFPTGATVIIVARDNAEDGQFAASLRDKLAEAGHLVKAVIHGGPPEARRELHTIASDNGRAIDAIACSEAVGKWQMFLQLGALEPSFGQVHLVRPQAYVWPNFLKTENLLNVANQIVVIAIIAIGMTFVIVAGGIDLSVGSLIALSSIVATLLIRDRFGGEEADVASMLLASAAAVAVCAAVGAFSGLCVVALDIPPFIVTLAMMLVARGSARILAKGNTIYQVPESFTWLGRGADLFAIPNSVVLMICLYVAAHVLMSSTVLGRNIYAVGGNRVAAFLSGVPVKSVLLFTYVSSGCLAGLGGIIVASMFKSGSPNYGLMDELDVIAAVVVGGTSLSGGRGTIFGTLIGAFIIAVIRNTMNLTNVKPYTQDVILGLVILAAVTVDRIKMRMIRT
jgi:ribose transport system permease protein